MFYTTNLSVDQYWWWWVVHLWVEATWEVLVGCIMAWGLMKTLGVRRRIVTTWLYIEVALMFGSGILGLGHHYFWIGTPEYWLGIGGFFSALEPVPLVAMVVYAVYDAGRHGFQSNNHPALAWLIAHAFGNFLGAGVWGFIQTLPQINIYTRRRQGGSLRRLPRPERHQQQSAVAEPGRPAGGVPGQADQGVPRRRTGGRIDAAVRGQLDGSGCRGLGGVLREFDALP